MQNRNNNRFLHLFIRYLVRSIFSTLLFCLKDLPNFFHKVLCAIIILLSLACLEVFLYGGIEWILLTFPLDIG